jgi:glycosyltransferase involved in cell wall biosynthesis
VFGGEFFMIDDAQTTRPPDRADPAVSVVTPTYNRGPLLRRIHESLKHQTVSFEWIVVDDGSTDDTQRIVEEMRDPSAVYLKMPRNSGVNAARNAGLKRARGAYIQLLDSDDEFVPGGLDRAVESLRAAPPNVGAVLLDAKPAGEIRGLPTLTDGEILREYDLVCRLALQGDKATIYRREVFDLCSLPEDLSSSEHVFVFEVSKHFDYLWRARSCVQLHRQNDNLSEPDNLIRRSHDIAVSYERIVRNHSALLARYPSAAARLLTKAMYRYLVASDWRNGWRVYWLLLRLHPTPRTIGYATGALFMGLLAPLGIERMRLQRRAPRIPVLT